MKTKKVLALVIAMAISATAVVSASAATLTEQAPDGSAEVTAKILGTEPGEVNYIITIPDKVDFGNLTQPTENEDSYKDIAYTVTATEINNLPANQWVMVRVKDRDATLENDQFYITQKTTPHTKLTYDVYDNSSIETSQAINLGDMNENGYLLTAFSASGQEINGMLRLNQKQIYGQDLDTIAGDYSGYMVFHSSITNIQ